jgi:threonyl-tRNA synthetase
LLATVAVDAELVEEEEIADLPTNDNDEGLLRIRHSSAHVMAMAVQQIFPEAQCTIGPWIDNGFYYDFFFPETTDAETGETIAARKLSEQDLKLVKKAMDKIISKDYPIFREEVTREEAERRIKTMDEPFKLEILESIKTEPITIYHIGDQWWDLCAGPHVSRLVSFPRRPSTYRVRRCYWRGDENREISSAFMLPPEGTALKVQKDDRKPHHRMLGKPDLF